MYQPYGSDKSNGSYNKLTEKKSYGANPPKKKLLDQVKEVIRMKHYSIR